MLGIIYFWVKGRENRIRAKEVEQSEINNRLNKLEIKALRAKMNPHFIFNALNSIQHLIIEKDEDAALYYLNKFSKLIRKVLDKASESKIELSEEVNILKNYIELEALRFDAPFNYEIYVDQSLLDEHIEIPYLLIQPFVENAIHHGLIHKDDGGQLNIKIMEQGDNIFISVEDNGIGRSASKALKGNNPDKISYGISVTKERLELMAQKAHSETFKILDLYDNLKKPAGTRVEIKIPIIN
jgi:LytS/YehU family sensor histidine kinase